MHRVCLADGHRISEMYLSFCLTDTRRESLRVRSGNCATSMPFPRNALQAIGNVQNLRAVSTRGFYSHYCDYSPVEVGIDSTGVPCTQYLVHKEDI